MQSACRTPRQIKAWSQNLGHENIATTLTSYGTIDRRQPGEVIRAISLEPEAQGADLLSKSVPSRSDRIETLAQMALRRVHPARAFGKAIDRFEAPNVATPRSSMSSKRARSRPPDWNAQRAIRRALVGVHVHSTLSAPKAIVPPNVACGRSALYNTV